MRLGLCQQGHAQNFGGSDDGGDGDLGVHNVGAHAADERSARGRSSSLKRWFSCSMSPESLMNEQT